MEQKLFKGAPFGTQTARFATATCTHLCTILYIKINDYLYDGQQPVHFLVQVSNCIVPFNSFTCNAFKLSRPIIDLHPNL